MTSVKIEIKNLTQEFLDKLIKTKKSYSIINGNNYLLYSASTSIVIFKTDGDFLRIYSNSGHQITISLHNDYKYLTFEGFKLKSNNYDIC